MAFTYTPTGDWHEGGLGLPKQCPFMRPVTRDHNPEAPELAAGVEYQACCTGSRGHDGRHGSDHLTIRTAPSGAYLNIVINPVGTPVLLSLATLGFPTLEPLLDGLDEPRDSLWEILWEQLDDPDRPLSLSSNGPRALQFHELGCLRLFFGSLDRTGDHDWAAEILQLLPAVDSFASFRRDVSPAFSRRRG